MRRLTLVRHGQSLANAGGVTMKHADIPLTELGWQQAAAVALQLPPTPSEVLCSPFLRALDTSRPCCERLAIQARPLAELQEMDAIAHQLLAGMTGEQRRPIADAYWAEADPARRMGEQAETFQEFAARVRRFRQHHMPALSAEVVAFGHGIWISMLIWQLLGFGSDSSADMQAFRRFQLGLPMANTAIYRFDELPGGRWLPQVSGPVD
ncbi:MAG: histidine phosphatase family protein [Roseateles depolymerans]|uniref:Histidine phosphatase family protein n=1 Tax=Roseateles depolymerans TaxID=76731 RepID=A0A2W5DQA2_9BURK|nr:MAG: histidine phosphatase family protein [Roseateles depolymerans]